MTGPEEEALPKNFYLAAKDYDPAQVKVVAHRRGSIAQIRQLSENLNKAIGSLAVADSQGCMGYALDVVQGINEDITLAVAGMVKAHSNAEQRYDNRAHAAAAEPPADVMAHNAAVLSRLIPG